MSFFDCVTLRYNGASCAFLTYKVICEGDIPPKFEAEVDELIKLIKTNWRHMAPALTKLFDDRRKIESNAMLIVLEISDDLESVGRVTLQLSINRDIDENLLRSMLEHYFEQPLKAKLASMLVGPIDIVEGPDEEDLYLDSRGPLDEDPITNEYIEV